MMVQFRVLPWKQKGEKGHQGRTPKGFLTRTSLTISDDSNYLDKCFCGSSSVVVR